MTLACGRADSKTQATAPVENELEVSLNGEQIKNMDLKVGEVSLGEVSETLKLQGKIDVPPQNLVSISIPLGGYLKATKLLPGTHVRKGQLLAVFEDAQYIQLQQDYMSSANKLDYATKELGRQKELNLNKASSDKALQIAETEYQNLKVEQAALSEKLKLINIEPSHLKEGRISRAISIYSPIDGYVSKVNVNIGKYVNPSDVIFELINPHDIHLNLTVYEKDSHKISIGQKVLAYTNAQPDMKYETEVILVSHNVKEGGGIEVHCHFEKYDRILLPGMYMNAELKFKTEKLQSLPDEAVVSFESKEYVFEELSKGKFKMLEVEAGESLDGRVSVRTDLNLKRIVLKGAYSLLMKLKNTSDE